MSTESRPPRRSLADALAGRATYGEQLRAQQAQTQAEQKRSDLAGLRFRRRDQLGNGLERQVVVDRDHHRADAEPDDGHEIPLGVEVERLERVLVHRQRRGKNQAGSTHHVEQ